MMPTRPPRPCPAARSTTTPRDWTPGPARQAHRTAADTPAEVPGHAATDRTGGDRAASRRRRGGAGGAAQPGRLGRGRAHAAAVRIQGRAGALPAPIAPAAQPGRTDRLQPGAASRSWACSARNCWWRRRHRRPGRPAYIRARSDARRLAGPEGIDAALAAHQLDALVAPTTGVAWPIRSEGDDFPARATALPLWLAIPA